MEADLSAQAEKVTWRVNILLCDVVKRQYFIQTAVLVLEEFLSGFIDFRLRKLSLGEHV